MIIITSVPVCNDQALRSVLVLFLIGRENGVSFSTVQNAQQCLTKAI